MTTATATRRRAKEPAALRPVLRYGLAEFDAQPGGAVPTTRVAKAVHITPALAQDWLDRYADPQKRHIRPRKVDEYAEKMTACEWLEMSKAIEFIVNGGNDTHLSDGHHRLRAIVKSGVPLWFEVKFGEPPQSRRIEGVRLSRSPGDMLRMEGCPGYQSEIGAGIRNTLLYDQTMGTDTRWRESMVNIPDAEDVVLTWLEDPALWLGVAPITKGLVSSWPTGTAQGALTAFTAVAERAHPGKGLDFIRLTAGGGGPRDGRARTVLGIFIQTQRVRPQVKNTARSGTQMELNRYTMCVMVRAFNAWMLGRSQFQRPEWSAKPFVLDRIR